MTVLIHIGYPKAASTFLQNWFSSRSEVFYSGTTLAGYIRTGEVPKQISVPNNAYSHFVISEEQLSVWQGHLDIVGVKFKPFDVKAHQEKTCKELRSKFPDTKILIVTRGFEGAVKSMYSQYVTIGGILTFNDFIKDYASILAEFYDYSFLIDCYRKYFSAENVLILPLELLKENEAAFIALIETKINLPQQNVKLDKANLSLESAEMESYRKLSLLIYKIIQPFPRTLQQYVYGPYVYALYQRKFHSLLKYFVDKKVSFEVDKDVLKLFSGKAKTLETENLFHPYLKEYLL